MLKQIIQNFDDNYFQSSLIVTVFNIKKKKINGLLQWPQIKNSIFIVIPFNFQLISLLTSTIISFKLN